MSAESPRDLLERLERAAAAAEGLVAEAARSAAARVPPAGWQAAGGDDPAPRELELLAGLLGGVRELVPEELAAKLGDALRELLLAVRALIDWYLERAEQRRREPTEVEDIPIS